MSHPSMSVQENPDVLASNKAILRRRFPELLPLLESYESRWQESVTVQASRSGPPTISVQGSRATVHVHSTFRPRVEGERWARDALDGDWDFAVVFGLGLGYHLEALLRERPQARLVVIEPRPEVFFAALALKDQERLLSHPYLQLMVGGDPNFVARHIFARQLKALLDDAPLLVLPSAMRYASDYWKAFESRLVDLLRATRSDVATRRKFQIQWLNNFFMNLATAAGDPGVASLKHKLSGRPAIIASAGPSLEKNVHLLREAKGKAVIVSAGSTINALLKYGVEPDLLVSFDPGKANYQHFENLDTPNLPLVYVPTIYPRIVEEYKGPRFTAAMDVFPFVDWVFDELGEDKGLLASGPSVANVSWHLAHVLGFNPVILVGQDLAFTDGKTHAAGAAHAQTLEPQSLQWQSGIVMTEGIDGEPVPTSTPMYSMKVWFEQRLASVPTGHVTIDATEGGTKIAGTTIMTLKEALEEYCHESFEPYETIMSVYRAATDRLLTGDVQKRLQQTYGRLHDELLAVERLAQDGLTDAERLLRESSTRRLNEQRLREAVTRLGRRNKALAENSVFKVFIQPVIVHILRAINTLMLARQEKETDLYAKGAAFAQQYLSLFSSTRDMTRHIMRLIKEQTEANFSGHGRSSGWE